MFWKHIDDVIALFLVISMVALIACHIDTQAWGILGLAASWVFRSGLEARKK